MLRKFYIWKGRNGVKQVREGYEFSILPYVRSGIWIVKVEEERPSRGAVWMTGWGEVVGRPTARKSAKAKGKEDNTPSKREWGQLTEG